MKTRAELEEENDQIRSLLLQKELLIESKDSAIESKDTLIDQLKEALVLAQRRQFAKATETLRSLQSELFNEPELESDIAPPLDEDSDDAIDVPFTT